MFPFCTLEMRELDIEESENDKMLQQLEEESSEKARNLADAQLLKGALMKGMKEIANSAELPKQVENVENELMMVTCQMENSKGRCERQRLAIANNKMEQESLKRQLQEVDGSIQSYQMVCPTFLIPFVVKLLS